ncbi:EamA family transporter [Lottiidibacillus patelloidae]|uniref:EamA family transporter n=1 Tax=Lottiidibacillus patelloidae TaxID=2670334 RepID=A0A263BYV0_9BACI|nr:DMT family transporter [Lottiidibacillus patelloidae]OZM58346.1 EamA family transporter [Lottiidibacillus patelloidae]
MKAETFFTNRWGILLSVVAATFLWGSAFPVIKLSYEALDIQKTEIGEQILFAGYRFFLAALFIILFMILIKKRTFIKKENMKTLANISFFQTFLQYILFYIGLSLSTGIQGSIIAGTTSFFQIIFAHFMYKDDALSWKKSIGLCIGFTGVIFVNLTKGEYHFDFGIGEFLLLLAMVTGAYGNILAKNGTTKMDVANLTSFQMLLGSIGLLVIGGISSGFLPFTFDIKSTLLLFYLALLSAVGFILWNNIMKYNKVGKVSIFLFLIPVFGVLLSNILLHEPVHFFVLIGLVFVASGIVIVNRKEKRS